MSENRDRIRKLASYIKKNPSDSFSKFALALELLKNNQVEKALKLFESIYRNDPEYVGTYYHLGKLYLVLDRIEDAETCFREGLEIARRQDEHQTLKELKEALQELEEEIDE